jgi:hypothetical protein
VCDCWARARVRLPAATTVAGKQYISRYINRTYCATLPTGREWKKIWYNEKIPPPPFLT